jgi:Uma2 family endonuclease
MATAFEGRFTPQEYLARERASLDSKSEYVNGHIYAMGGASHAHNQIVFNLARELGNQIRGGPCSASVNDMRVKVPRTEMYTYPDVVVVCGEPQLEDDHFDTLLNPAIIIEVLSPSTERYDRGDKWAHFRQLETLQTYVLVAQDEMRVETFTRRGDEWIYAEASGADGVLNLEPAECSIRLDAIYEHVKMGGAGRKSGGAAGEQKA